MARAALLPGFRSPEAFLLRWKTRFGAWVHHYGATRLAQDLGLSCGPHGPVAVYQWLGGSRTPRPAYAQRMVQLSRGKVGLDDIYAQRARVRPPAT